MPLLTAFLTFHVFWQFQKETLCVCVFVCVFVLPSESLTNIYLKNAIYKLVSQTLVFAVLLHPCKSAEPWINLALALTGRTPNVPILILKAQLISKPRKPAY